MMYWPPWDRNRNPEFVDALRNDDVASVERLIANDSVSLNMPYLMMDFGGEVARLPLTIAAIEQNREMVELLLRNGADINAIHDDETACTAALIASSGKSDLLALFVERGADISNSLASSSLSVQAKLRLIKTGAPINTAVLTAVAALDSRIVRLLIEQRSTDFSLLRDASGNTPCHLTKDDRALHLLINEAGLDMNAVNTAGQTPAFVCAKQSRFRSLTYLILNGADLDKPDNMGRTPLHEACRRSSVRLFPLLVGGGVDLNLRSNDGTLACHLALPQSRTRKMTDSQRNLALCARLWHRERQFRHNSRVD